MAIFILNIPCQAYRFREVVKEHAAYLYHRNLTSAGYSASSVEKYHYLSDRHRHIGCNPILITGFLSSAVPPVLKYFPDYIHLAGRVIPMIMPASNLSILY